VPHLTLDDLVLEPTIYLLPECEGKEEAIEHLREFCSEIFEEQLDVVIGHRRGRLSAT
jgi:hypothetical protein